MHGGNRFKRIDYTDVQVEQLVDEFIELGCETMSVFSKRDKKTMELWKYDLAINMSRNSKHLFQFLVHTRHNTIPACVDCKKQLSKDDLDERSNLFKKRCSVCATGYSWAKGENISIEDMTERGKNISKTKSEFYKTEEGKKVAAIIGQKNSVNMKNFNKTEKGKENIEKSRILNKAIMLDKIAKGEFSPPVTNSWTHWAATITTSTETKKFRSSWEACFWLSNPNVLYEIKRIPYQDEAGATRTYIADFFDEERKIVYELKPKSHWNKANTKMQQIIRYCLDNDIKFLWLNEHNIMNYIDENLFIGENKQQLDKLKKGLK